MFPPGLLFDNAAYTILLRFVIPTEIRPAGGKRKFEEYKKSRSKQFVDNCLGIF